MIIDLRDYVPPDVYKTFGDRSRIFLDPRIYDVHRVINERFHTPSFVNNYHKGGKLSQRGFRLPTTTTGAPLSQHRFGRAIDFTVPGISAQEVYDDIMESPQFLIDVGVTTIENISFTKKGNWIHLDCRDLGMKITSLKVVTP